MDKNKTIKILAGVVIAAFLVIIVVILYFRNGGTIDNFEKCAAAGYPILDSYPEQCRTPEGKSFTKPYAIGDSVTYIGTLVCLPHKDTRGPQTLECAYGLRTNDGKYHGLKDDGQLVFGLSINDEVQVTGTITENTSSIYNIVDTVQVETITQI